MSALLPLSTICALPSPPLAGDACQSGEESRLWAWKVGLNLVSTTYKLHVKLLSVPVPQSPLCSNAYNDGDSPSELGWRTGLRHGLSIRDHWTHNIIACVVAGGLLQPPPQKQVSCHPTQVILYLSLLLTSFKALTSIYNSFIYFVDSYLFIYYHLSILFPICLYYETGISRQTETKPSCYRTKLRSARLSTVKPIYRHWVWWRKVQHLLQAPSKESRAAHA